MCIRNRNFLLSKLLFLRFTVWFLNGFLIIFFSFIYYISLYIILIYIPLIFFSSILSLVIIVFKYCFVVLLLLALAALRPPYYIEKIFSLSLAYNFYICRCVVCECVCDIMVTCYFSLSESSSSI